MIPLYETLFTYPTILDIGHSTPGDKALLDQRVPQQHAFGSLLSLVFHLTLNLGVSCCGSDAVNINFASENPTRIFNFRPGFCSP